MCFIKVVSPFEQVGAVNASAPSVKPHGMTEKLKRDVEFTLLNLASVLQFWYRVTK